MLTSGSKRVNTRQGDRKDGRRTSDENGERVEGGQKLVEYDIGVLHPRNLLRHGSEKRSERRDGGGEDGDSTKLSDDFVQLGESGSQSTQKVVERSNEEDVANERGPEEKAVEEDVAIIL